MPEFQERNIKGSIVCSECGKNFIFVDFGSTGSITVPCPRCGRILEADLDDLTSKMTKPASLSALKEQGRKVKGSLPCKKCELD